MSKAVDDFIGINSSFWSDTQSSEKKILVAARNLPKQIITTSVTARFLADMHDAEPLIVSHYKKDHPMHRLYDSFGLNKILNVKNGLKNPLFYIQAFLMSIKGLFMVWGQPDYQYFIENFKVKSVHLGDTTYDLFIRNDHRYLDAKKRKLQFFVFLLKSVLNFLIHDALFERNAIKYVITTTNVYASTGALLGRIALSRNIPVILCSGTYTRLYKDYNDFRASVFRVSNSFVNELVKQSDVVKRADTYLADRFAGNINQHDVKNAFKGKTIWTKTDLLNHYGFADHRFTNIGVIFPHCFSDANHVAGALVFEGFYKHLTETLEFIKTVPDTLWIIKPHPSAHIYDEEGAVQKEVEKYNFDHIQLCPDGIHTASFFDFADLITTVNGTVALEAACKGIRPLLAGDAVFSDFGFTYNPVDKTDYFSVLSDISKLKKLTDDEIKKARVFFYWYMRLSHIKSAILQNDTMTPNQKDNAFDDNLHYSAEQLKDISYDDDVYIQKLKTFLKEGGEVLSDI